MSKRLLNRLSKFVLFSLTLNVALVVCSIHAAAVVYSVPQTAEAEISWDHNSPQPEGYRVYQRKSGQTYDYTNPVWAGANNSTTVYNLEYDTTYYFVVRAYDGALEGVDSEEVSFMSPTPAPPTYTISSTASGPGTISPAGATTITEGANQTYSITPDIGYAITDVVVDGVSQGALAIYTFSSIGCDHTIVATFEAILPTNENTSVNLPDTNDSNETAVDSPTDTDGLTQTDITQVIDDGESGTTATGQWSVSSGVDPYGSQSLYSYEAGATYSYASTMSGVQDVELWWTQTTRRCTSVPVKIYDGATLLETVVVDQQQDGGQWNFLGTYNFTDQARVVVQAVGGSCSTGTDAVAFSKAENVVAELSSQVIDDGESGTTAMGQWSVSSGVDPYGSQSLYSYEAGATYSYASTLSGAQDVELWWTQTTRRCTSVPVKIYDGSTLLETVAVNQQQDGGQWNFLGTYDFTDQARVVVQAVGGSCSTGTDAVEFTEADNTVTELSYQVIDDGESGTTTTGQWSVSSGVDPYGSQSLYSYETGATYSYASTIPGAQDVELWWTQTTRRCTSVPVKIYDGSTLLETVIVNQQQAGGQWNLLGTYDFTDQASVVVEAVGGSCSTGTDAVAFSKTNTVVAKLSDQIIDDGESGTARTGQWSVSSGVDPYGSQSLYSYETGATYSYASALSGAQNVELWWTQTSKRCTSVPVRIYDGPTLLDTVVVNQQQNGGQWNLLGSYEFSNQAKVVIEAESGNCSTGADALRYSMK